MKYILAHLAHGNAGTTVTVHRLTVLATTMIGASLCNTLVSVVISPGAAGVL